MKLFRVLLFFACMVFCACSIPFVSGESDAPDALTLEDVQGCYYYESYEENLITHWDYNSQKYVSVDSMQSFLTCKKLCIEGENETLTSFTKKEKWSTKNPSVKESTTSTGEMDSKQVILFKPENSAENYWQQGIFENNFSYFDMYRHTTEFYEKKGVKYFDGYSSKGWEICEE